MTIELLHRDCLLQNKPTQTQKGDLQELEWSRLGWSGRPRGGQGTGCQIWPPFQITCSGMPRPTIHSNCLSVPMIFS
jgi:hypothetical protein